MTTAIIDGKRYRLDTMTDLNASTKENHGVRLVAARYDTRTGRIVRQFYSIWESSRRDGTVVGEYYDVTNRDDNDYGLVVESLCRASESAAATLRDALPVIEETP